jgi:hypothetical protein
MAVTFTLMPRMQLKKRNLAVMWNINVIFQRDTNAIGMMLIWICIMFSRVVMGILRNGTMP